MKSVCLSVLVVCLIGDSNANGGASDSQPNKDFDKNVVELVALQNTPQNQAQNRAQRRNNQGRGGTTRKVQDGKNRKTGKPAPDKDPDLEQYAIFETNAPRPSPVASTVTELPLKLQKGDRVVLIGNTLFDRGASYGHFESLVQQQFPDLDLRFRTLAWSADEIDLRPRPKNFGDLDQHLFAQKADVIFAAYGFNESFAGEGAIPDFKNRLSEFLRHLKSHAYNGESGPQVILVSPTANENVPGVNGAHLNNARIESYVAAMSEVAGSEAVGFVDVFGETKKAMMSPNSDLTFNGVHLVEAGYRVFSESLFSGTFGLSRIPALNEIMRQVVIDKNQQFFYRYRPLNTFYYTGDRNKQYGYLDFLPAMRNFDIMVDNRDQRIWSLAKGASVSASIDDSNVPPLPPTAESRGANEWLSPADELKAFEVDPGFDVNLFASEEDFPDIACPIQMRWDERGRLWVSCSTTYPHVYPGRKPEDKIVILEDTDWDGKADKSTVFADDVHIPLSFELGDGGVYVSEEPHLTFLKDTDGDGKADFRRRLLTGFGTEDSHHALHDFVWTPDGDLLFRESIFHHSQVETVYGPIRADNSAWFRFRPSTHELVCFGNYPNTNPWGVTFDDWGQHVASHPIFASAFHATNPAYPTQHPRPTGIPAYSGTAGQEFIDFEFWPEAMQGGFVKARYKPNNRIEIHKWVEHADSFTEEYVSDLIFSTNLSFIPVDMRFGPRGAMYICDWYNPIKGHAQYSLRDERRDRLSGRIWRVVPKGATLLDPPQIAEASVEQLVTILERPEYRYRYWAKRELRERDSVEVQAVLDKWVRQLGDQDERFRHHQVEGLWLYRNIGKVNTSLIEELLECENHYARAAATRQLRYWFRDLEEPYEALARRAVDESGLVRMEAVIAASYIGTRAALESVLPVLDSPGEGHLQYAIATAFGAEKLARHWRGETQIGRYPELAIFYAAFGKSSKRQAGQTTRSANEAAFDNQKGVKVVEISTIPERMLFTVGEFSAKAGQPVKLIFTNPDVTPHNLVIVSPGSSAEIGIAANEMARSPDGVKKQFIPSSKKILHYTQMLEQDTSDVLRFTAPDEPGEYPYICTFPGHWIIMKGVMQIAP
jgi:plastocyanin